VTILETLEEIFSHIAVPQNLAKKVSLVKSQVSALEQRNVRLEDKNVHLAAELKESKAQNEKMKADYEANLASLLSPEQGLKQQRPQVVLGRRKPLTGRHDR